MFTKSYFTAFYSNICTLKICLKKVNYNIEARAMLMLKSSHVLIKLLFVAPEAETVVQSTLDRADKSSKRSNI